MCADPNAESFTTPLGPWPAAVNATGWRYDPTGFAQSQLFLALAGATQIQPVHFGVQSTVPQSTASWEEFCVLRGVGPAGDLVPGCDSGLNTSSPRACYERCTACSKCEWWQREANGRCWLKGTNVTLEFGGGSGEATGARNCSSAAQDLRAEIFPVTGLLVHTTAVSWALFVENAASTAVSLSTGMISAIIQNATQGDRNVTTRVQYTVHAPANHSVVVSQGLDPTTFIVTTTGTVEAVGIVLQPYSLATLRWAE